MPMPCEVSIDAGSALVISTASPTVLVQGTTSSSKPIRIKRVQFQSSNNGSTQQTVVLSYGFYATGTSTGGVARTPIPVDAGSGYSPTTAFYVNTTTLGTTFTQKYSFTWNTANPFDLLMGLEELQDEIPAGKAWAWILPAAPGSAVSVTGTINFEEFG